MERKFISQILEYLGYFSAFAVAFSQYFLRDAFRQFFESDLKLYSVSSIFALLISVVIIVAIFSSRYSLDIKKYFSNKQKNEYFKKLREQRGRNNQEYILEPISFTSKHVALALIILLFAFFYFFISTGSIYIRSMMYIAIVVSIVSSITIYATSLYLQNDWRQNDSDKNEIISSKIKEYFAGDIKINFSWRDDSNFAKPFQKMVIERDGKKYNVTVDVNDPNKFFSVEEIIK